MLSHQNFLDSKKICYVCCYKIILILLFVESYQAFVFPSEKVPCEEETGKVCVPIANCLETIDINDNNSRKICGWTNDRPHVCCSTKERLQIDEGCGVPDFRPIIVSSLNKEEGRVLHETTSKRFSDHTPTSPRTTTTGHAIAGGDASLRNSRPWMAAIRFRSEENDVLAVFCGGALISQKYVLTAAHCFDGKSTDPKNYDVILGRNNLSPEKTGLPVDSIIVHPEYKPPSLYNDIALIRLKDRVTYTNSTRSICLPDSEDVKSVLQRPLMMVIAAGWGRTGFFEGTSDILLEVRLPIVNNSRCNDIYHELNALSVRYAEGLTDKILCAGFEDQNKDTCPGDSGGPLFVLSPQTQLWTVLGIISSGFRCAVGVPGIYTNVVAYLDWIEKNISS